MLQNDTNRGPPARPGWQELLFPTQMSYLSKALSAGAVIAAVVVPLTLHHHAAASEKEIVALFREESAKAAQKSNGDDQRLTKSEAEQMFRDILQQALDQRFGAIPAKGRNKTRTLRGRVRPPQVKQATLP